MPTPPASQMPVMSRLGAGAALVLVALMAESGRPARFQSCAPVTAGTAKTSKDAHHVFIGTLLTIRGFTSRITAHCAGGGAAAGAGPIAVNVLPSGSTTLRSRPIGAPFFTGCRLTVTTSPTLNEERAQPRLVMSVGLLTSTAQFRTVPVSSIASNFRKQWGLAQIQSVTVPFSVKSLLVSKLAVPWCAATGAVIRAMSPKMNTAREHLAFTEASLAIGDRLTASVRLRAGES